VWVAGFAWAAFSFSRAPAHGRTRVISSAAIIILAAGLMTHQLPGFNNPRVIDSVRLTPDALPFRSGTASRSFGAGSGSATPAA